MDFDKVLPFPRGSTYSDKNLLSTAADAGSSYPGIHLAGSTYVVPDTVHKKHPFVRLRAVFNHSTALTVARKCMAFNTGAGEHGRYVSVITAGNGVPGLPIDDAYAVNYVIPKSDIFYVVDEGPCDILVTASQTDAAAMALGLMVTTEANGVLDASAAAASGYQLGILDEDPLTAATAYRVYVRSNLIPATA